MGSVTILFLLPLLLLLSPVLLPLVAVGLLIDPPTVKQILGFFVIAPLEFGWIENYDSLLASFPWLANLLTPLFSWLFP